MAKPWLQMCKTLQICYPRRNMILFIYCKTAPRNNDSNNCSTTNPNAPIQRTALYQSESFFDNEFKTCYSCQSNEEEVVTPADQEKKQRWGLTQDLSLEYASPQTTCATPSPETMWCNDSSLDSEWNSAVLSPDSPRHIARTGQLKCAVWPAQMSNL